MSQALPKVCIIGAGSSGIAACKVFKENHIPFDCFECSDRLGGNWVFKNKNGMSSAYRSLHINTSRDKMAYSDFPMPDHLPHFPSHYEVADYFESYVDHFGFRDNITFNTKVERAHRRDDAIWEVTLSSGETKLYDVVMVANGHHWDPRFPNPAFPGEFNGDVIHSHHYIDPTDPIDLRGKNVVIVGMGNSAMDIACELGHKGVAENVYMAIRRGTHIVPKYFGSEPLDNKLRHPSEKPSVFEHLLVRLPKWLIDYVFIPLYLHKIRQLVGRPEDYGLPKPQQRFGQTHPTISNEIHIRLGSGDVKPKPNIQELMGDKIKFTDGSVEKVDAIIYATGYNITFPFFDDDFLPTKDNDIALYNRIVMPQYPDLLFLALVQPLCAMMPIAEQQSKWMAEYLTGRYHLPTRGQMEAETIESHEEMKSRYVASSRHTIQIDCQKYTYFLRQELLAGQKRAEEAGQDLPIKPRAEMLEAQNQSMGLGNKIAQNSIG